MVAHPMRPEPPVPLAAFPNFVNTDEGRGLLNVLLCYARDNVGFESSLAYGQRTQFFDRIIQTQFDAGGIFEGYRSLTRRILQQRFAAAENNFRLSYEAQGAHQEYQGILEFQQYHSPH